MASFEDDLIDLLNLKYPNVCPIDEVLKAFANITLQILNSPVETQPNELPMPPPISTTEVQVTFYNAGKGTLPPYALKEEDITLSPGVLAIIEEAENDPEPPRPLEEVLKGFDIVQTQTKKKNAKSRSREELEPDLLNADDDIF